MHDDNPVGTDAVLDQDLPDRRGDRDHPVRPGPGATPPEMEVHPAGHHERHPAEPGRHCRDDQGVTVVGVQDRVRPGFPQGCHQGPRVEGGAPAAGTERNADGVQSPGQFSLTPGHHDLGEVRLPLEGAREQPDLILAAPPLASRGHVYDPYGHGRVPRSRVESVAARVRTGVPPG